MEAKKGLEQNGERPENSYDFRHVQNILRSGLQDRDSGVLSVTDEEALGLYVTGLTFQQLGLKSEILKGIYAYPYHFPSLIQSAVIPNVLENPPKDMIVQSQNGTGKTAAFAVSILERVNLAKNWPQCLCVVPTYELAVQVGSVIRKLGAFMTGLQVGLAVRESDEDAASSSSLVRQHVIVGTPGTVLRWAVTLRKMDLSRVILFVVDEADEMVKWGGLGNQTSHISSLLPRICQRLFFSATLDNTSLAFASKLSNNPAVYRLRDEELSLDNVFQFYVRCADDEDKFAAVVDVYNTLIVGQCMVFCRTRVAALNLWRSMRDGGHAVSMLTAELAVRERADCIQRFRDGLDRVLIVTNVCARGIDVPYVNLVVNYDLPVLRDGRPDFCSYLHRIGRSGRFGMSGVALSFVRNDAEVEMVESIGAHFDKPIHYLTREQLKAIDEIVEPEI